MNETVPCCVTIIIIKTNNRKSNYITWDSTKREGAQLPHFQTLHPDHGLTPGVGEGLNHLGVLLALVWATPSGPGPVSISSFLMKI